MLLRALPALGGSPCLLILCFCCPWQVCSNLISVSLLCSPCWWMRSSAGQPWVCPDHVKCVWLCLYNGYAAWTCRKVTYLKCPWSWGVGFCRRCCQKPQGRAILRKCWFTVQIYTLLGKEVVPHLHGGTRGVLVLSEPDLWGAEKRDKSV